MFLKLRWLVPDQNLVKYPPRGVDDVESVESVGECG